MKKWIPIILPIVLVLTAGGSWLATRPTAAKAGATQRYELATIARGSIESVVSSTGTLAPVSEVSVLAQMSGRVEKVTADYNDHVKKGQVLLQLSTDMLKLQELQSDAAVRKAQANYDLYLVDCQNKTSLFQQGLIAEYDLKSSKTSLEVNAAELASARSALKVIQTELEQYALVTSPIDGIVIDRNVDVGQSVLDGSSPNATSLFTLAEDLARMEIKATVDELDISAIKVGQAVRFTVEANPHVTYAGTVHQVRLVPKTTDNVVTYSVMIDADNRDGTLLPGMTADIEFIKERKSGVLLVPAAALRFQPPSPSAAQPATTTQTKSTGLVGMMMPRPPQRPASSGAAAEAGTASDSQGRKTLWYMADDGSLGAYTVSAGLSNGTSTELLGAEELEGKKIIVKARAE